MDNAECAAPDGTIDVTEEVSELIGKLNEVFADKETHIITLAIGAMIGDVAPDEAWLKAVLGGIVETSLQTHQVAMRHKAEGSVH